jgi:RecB family endonuclease NucS
MQSEGDERTGLERDLEDFLVANLEYLETGLYFDERQVQTGVGVIDILATDKERKFVVIELKAGEAGDAAVGQIARYMGWYGKQKTPRTVRGILVAYKFTVGAQYAASLIPGLSLMKLKTTQFEAQNL